VADLVVVDASVLYEVLSSGPRFEAAMAALRGAEDSAAPELIDVEVLGLIRRDAARGAIDATHGRWAVAQVADWPGERYPHQPFDERVWELRHNVRTADAFYVALAEALNVPLLTLDSRLSRATGIACEVIVPS
jgi:predicted nucleic acid-binding protein